MSTAEVASEGLTHKRVLVWASVAQIVINLLVTVLSGEVIPPLIAVAVLLAVGLYLLRGKIKVGAAMLGIVSLLHLITSGPFVVDSLTHPDSFFDFFLGWAMVVSALVAVIVSVPVFKGRSSASSGLKTAVMGVAGLMVALGVLSAFSTLTQDDVAARSGDVLLTAEDAEFSPNTAEGSSGTVAVHIDNKDSFRHNFSIDELDIDTEIPASKGVRVTLGDVSPGSYAFYCAVPGHDDMKGTLVVE